VKVGELSGALLDYWVAKCEGREARIAEYTDGNQYCVVPAGVCGDRGWTDQSIYSPSTAWSIAGQIIERDRIEVTPWHDPRSASVRWCATAFEKRAMGALSPQRSKWGDTPLIAAMRCYVASKFGEEVPDEVTS
jgi:uncharacterized protein DUF2591